MRTKTREKQGLSPSNRTRNDGNGHGGSGRDGITLTTRRHSLYVNMYEKKRAIGTVGLALIAFAGVKVAMNHVESIVAQAQENTLTKKANAELGALPVPTPWYATKGGQELNIPCSNEVVAPDPITGIDGSTKGKIYTVELRSTPAGAHQAIVNYSPGTFYGAHHDKHEIPVKESILDLKDQKLVAKLANYATEAVCGVVPATAPNAAPVTTPVNPAAAPAVSVPAPPR